MADNFHGCAAERGLRRASAVDLLCPGGWPNRHATPEGLNYFSCAPTQRQSPTVPFFGLLKQTKKRDGGAILTYRLC